MTSDPTELRVPLAAEEIEVTRRVRTTGRVRVQTQTEQRVEHVDVELLHEDVEIERVTIGRAVTSPPDIRHEGDVTIIPVVEERLVVERRLFLIEEVRIRRVARTERHREEIVLRSQHAEIRRLPADEPQPGGMPGDPHTET